MASLARHHRRQGSGSQTLTEPLSPPKRPSDQSTHHSPRSHNQQFSSSPGSRQRPSSPIENESLKRPHSRGNQLSTLPVIQTKLHRADGDLDEPSTASTSFTAKEVLTPSSSYQPEFFASNNASPRSVVQNNRPSTARTSTAPIMSLNYSRLPKAEDVKESAHFRRRSEHLSNLERESALLANPAMQAEDKKGKPKQKDRSEREKKAMLAKALEKANTAVVLDNKQNFLGALDAYTDACMLLQQVMDRSVNTADRKKLAAIKVTYTNRIEELKQLEAIQADTNGEKSLPDRPRSNDSFGASPAGSPRDAHLQESSSIAAVSGAHMVDVPQLAYPESDQGDFFSKTMADVDRVAKAQNDPSSRAERSHIVNQRVSALPPPEQTRYLPAPLTTRKQASPTSPAYPPSVYQEAQEEPTLSPKDEGPISPIHADPSTWLNTIDESSGSSTRSSSVHSKTSERGTRRKALQAHHVASNSELDAAFDAAVEAAYDEGFEPDLDTPQLVAVPAVTPHQRAPSADIKEILSPTADAFARQDPAVKQAEDNEEERILDEFSQDYGHGFNFAFGTKSALPRQSDSSGYSRSTWQSSQVSERTTAGTSLSTVAENDLGLPAMPTKKPPMPNSSPISPVNIDNLPPLGSPPTAALPSLPKSEHLSGSTVRNRRLSGQNAKELKIETADQSGRKRASTLHHPIKTSLTDDDYDTDTHKEVSLGAPLELSPSEVRHEQMLKSPPSLDLLKSNRMIATPTDTIRSADDANLGNLLDMRPNLIRKNQSSLSLRADHTVLLPSPGLHEMAEPTPMSATFTTHKTKFDRDPLVSQRAALQSISLPSTSAASAGSYLFDMQLLADRAAYSPRSPGVGPAGLEPCPESLLLRPFWLMRCLASTITHPRGGYVTTKLFVPREVWQTRGVKLKSIEDKIANCDLLTAGLGQLSEVDTFDADAVMDELQRFEEVMERVQTALAKKLGGEVGVHGIGALFKEAAPPGSITTINENDKAADTLSGSTDKNAKSHSSKGYLSSWRKLRSKSSGAPVGHVGAAQSSRHLSGDKDANAMVTVPMTSFVPVERRGQKRDVRNLSFDGPNREYMGSLARLFQAVQILDQIARQVEDPGLKHSSQTHVGLELSIRHAAEFFSFYICRFVLADVTTLVDKFIKRGTEWVIA